MKSKKATIQKKIDVTKLQKLQKKVEENKNKNSTCWLILVATVKLWFSVLLSLKSHIITHLRVTNDDAPYNL